MTSFPPIVPPWNGDPALIVDEARKVLTMKLADPGVAVLQRLVGSAIDLVRNFVGWPSIPDTGQTTVPDPVRDGTIATLVEAYRRKELSFGVISSADADGVTFRVSADWLISNAPQLHYYRRTFGIA